MRYYHVSTNQYYEKYFLPTHSVLCNVVIFRLLSVYVSHSVSFRVLRVPRIAIHKNLFASLLLHCVSMITFKASIFLPYIQDGQPQKSLLQQVMVLCWLDIFLEPYFHSPVYFSSGFNILLPSTTMGSFMRSILTYRID